MPDTENSPEVELNTLDLMTVLFRHRIFIGFGSIAVALLIAIVQMGQPSAQTQVSFTYSTGDLSWSEATYLADQWSLRNQGDFEFTTIPEISTDMKSVFLGFKISTAIDPASDTDLIGLRKKFEMETLYPFLRETFDSLGRRQLISEIQVSQNFLQIVRSRLNLVMESPDVFSESPAAILGPVFLERDENQVLSLQLWREDERQFPMSLFGKIKSNEAKSKVKIVETKLLARQKLMDQLNGEGISDQGAASNGVIGQAVTSTEPLVKAELDYLNMKLASWVGAKVASIVPARTETSVAKSKGRIKRVLLSFIASIFGFSILALMFEIWRIQRRS